MYDTSPEPSPRIESSHLADNNDLERHEPLYDPSESNQPNLNPNESEPNELEVNQVNQANQSQYQYQSQHQASITAPSPVLIHALHHPQTSILSVAADERHIYSGSQAKDIYVWERKVLRIKATLSGHTGSVLVLETHSEKNWLFSASGDGTVRIWSTTLLSPLYVIHPNTESGDIYSLTYSSKLSTLFFGCQNTSIQWIDLSFATSDSSGSLRVTTTHDGTSNPGTPGKKFHKFFDSVPQAQRHHQQPQQQPQQSRPSTAGSTPVNEPFNPGPKEFQVSAGNVILPAHYGYVYCIALSASHPQESNDDEVYLFSGSGDEDVKLWLATKDGLLEKHTFTGCDGGVLSIVVRDGTIYAGCQDGHIKVFDQETKTLVQTLLVNSPPKPSTVSEQEQGQKQSQKLLTSDVLSLTIVGGDLYACLGNGWCQRWSSNFQSTGFWKAHDGIGLSSILAVPSTFENLQTSNQALLVTGGSDSEIKLWSIEFRKQKSKTAHSESGNVQTIHDLQAALAEFVAFPSVSNIETHREDCRQTALWLKQLLSQLGAEAQLLPTDPGVNSPVLAIFKGSEEHKNRPRVLFYGHYDVIPARKNGWNSEPFALSGRNGYLYGRGVTDNKGPILAAAFAISELRRKVALGLDLVMLIEGEEEAGSRGFEDIVSRHKDLIGPIDAILVSNSYWIGEDTPCITYGLRGVIHASIEISNQKVDLHSGVEGGGVAEPMFDMIATLNMLSVNGKIAIPNFYDNVSPKNANEEELYRLLEQVTGQSAQYLTAKWREPSLSIHAIQTSGAGNRTVIPSSVRSQVSIRIVPDQDLSEIAAALVQHIENSFASLHSPNSIKVTVDKAADWWLGNLEGPWFQALERAVEEEWGVRPLRIREGGSIPSIPFLEKTFACPALHLPLGQSSDQAHLANERLSINNLMKGKSVFERFFSSVAADMKSE